MLIDVIHKHKASSKSIRGSTKKPTDQLDEILNVSEFKFYLIITREPRKHKEMEDADQQSRATEIKDKDRWSRPPREEEGETKRKKVKKWLKKTAKLRIYFEKNAHYTYQKKIKA